MNIRDKQKACKRMAIGTEIKGDKLYYAGSSIPVQDDALTCFLMGHLIHIGYEIEIRKLPRLDGDKIVVTLQDAGTSPVERRCETLIEGLVGTVNAL